MPSDDKIFSWLKKISCLGILIFFAFAFLLDPSLYRLFLALIFLDYAKFEKKNEEIRKGDKGAKQ